jgi:hypothetical protein
MTESTTTPIVNDDEPLANQKWVCLSFLSPENLVIENRTSNIRGIKIRGVFNNYDDAVERAKYLQTTDKYFHVFVGEVGKWLPWDPNPEMIKDQVYAEEELNKIMKAYKDNLHENSVREEQRKNDLLKDVKTNQERVKELEKLRKKLHETKEVFNIDTKDKDDKTSDQKEQIKETEKELHSIENKINSNDQDMETIEKNLNKIKMLYSQIKTKQN